MAQSSALTQRLHNLNQKLSDTRKEHLEARKKQHEVEQSIALVLNQTRPIVKAKKDADTATISTLYEASRVRNHIYAIRRALPALHKEADRMQRVKAKKRHFGPAVSEKDKKHNSAIKNDDGDDEEVPEPVLALLDPDFAHPDASERRAIQKAAKDAIKALSELKQYYDPHHHAKGKKHGKHSKHHSAAPGGRFAQVMGPDDGGDDSGGEKGDDDSEDGDKAKPSAAADTTNEAEVQLYEKKAASLQKSVEDAQAALQQAKSALAQSTEALAEQREQSSALSETKLKDAEATLDLKNRFDKERDRIASMRVTFDNSTKALTKVKDAISETRFQVEMLVGHYESVKHRLAATQQEEQRMEAMARDLENAIAKAEEDRSDSVVALKSSISEKIQRKRILSKDIAAQTSAKSLAAQQVEFLQHQVKATSAQVTSLEHLLSSLKSDEEALTRKQSSLRLDIEHATQRLQHATADIPPAVSQRDEMTKEAQALEKAVAALKTSLSAALAEVKAATKTVETLSSQRKSVNAAIAQLKVKNAADEQSSMDLTEEINSINTAIEETEDDTRAKVLKREKLLKKLEEATRAHDRAAARLQKVQRNLAELKAAGMKDRSTAKELLEELGYNKKSNKQHHVNTKQKQHHGQHENARFQQAGEGEAAEDGSRLAAELSGEVEAEEVPSLD
jgi:chromosome segregation ATPase